MNVSLVYQNIFFIFVLHSPEKFVIILTEKDCHVYYAVFFVLMKI